MNEYNPYQDLQQLLSHREPTKTPVVLWYTRSSLGLQGAAKKLIDYYQNSEIKLETQLIDVVQCINLSVRLWMARRRKRAFFSDDSTLR